MLWLAGNLNFAQWWQAKAKIPLIVCLLVWLAVGRASAAPTQWIRAEDGLPTSTSDPSLFRFGAYTYILVNGELYLQHYNQPCFGWSKVAIPAGINTTTPVGDYLFAVGAGLWWLEEGNSVIIENWHKVTSSGLPSGADIYPMAIFNGQLYGVIHYVKSGASQSTFDLYRTPDIGSETMTWSKVVAEGFGDPQNHALGYLGVFKAKLIAITTLTHDGLFGDVLNYLDGIEVWESATGDLGTWTQVNDDGFGTTVTGGGLPSPVKANCNLGDAAEYDGYLYVGTKSHLGAEIWRYDGTGKSGWTNVTPITLGIYFGSGPGRVERMVVFNDLLYEAEGFPTANLMTYDGTTWQSVESGPNPFDSANISILGLATSASATVGEKLFLQTHVFGGGYQLWSHPFTTTPLTCSALNLATISLSPKAATNELGSPEQTHTVTATINAGTGADFSDLVVSGRIEVQQATGIHSAHGFFGADGTLAFAYSPLQGPQGLNTDSISACFYSLNATKCDTATKTWVDTIPPQITITVPHAGAVYALNAVVPASFIVTDAVGVASSTSTVPDGTPIATGPIGVHQFAVSATDSVPNSITKTVTYTVGFAPTADAGPAQSVAVGAPVAFDGSGSTDQDGSIVTYAWNFGDGTKGTGVAPTHTYASAGLKNVTLTVTDSDGLTDADSVQITVTAPTTHSLMFPLIMTDK